MNVSEWTSVVGLAVAIIVPLGTLTWVASDRARIARASLVRDIHDLHVALDAFRVVVADDIGEIRGRIISMEGRSYRVRRGDPDAVEL